MLLILELYSDKIPVIESTAIIKMTSTLHKRIITCTFLLSFTILIMYYKESLIIMDSGRSFETRDLVYHGSQYLVSSSKCKIPNLNPFDPDVKKFHKIEEYLSCSDLPLLTYITRSNNVATLHINTTILPLYSTEKILCHYANITMMKNKKDPDNHVALSKFEPIDYNVTLSENFIVVKCSTLNTKNTVYENTHAVAILNKDTLKKTKLFSNGTRPLSVLLLGIDGVSRLNFIRSLPESHKFLIEDNWISLKGYNKIADNTFPNLMAILTGYDSVFKKCVPKKSGMSKRCPFIWDAFRNLGYVTGYAEDESWISTFNHEKKGFLEPPTDYYYRPYILQSEQLNVTIKDGLKYCTGPESTGERMLNLAKDFACTFKNSPNFGLFWMNSFSHNTLNGVSRMDDKIKQFLEDITVEGVLENTMVVFFSDHGLRCGDFLQTAIGWFEERLPFIYIWIPNKFKAKFPEEYDNLESNAGKLTSPYDLYMTLQHILVLSDLDHAIKPSKGCQNCKSLFTRIDNERSCNEAGIDNHWCTCTDFVSLSKKDRKLVEKASRYLLDELRYTIDKTSDNDQCITYSLDKVVKAGVSKSYKKDKYFLLIVQTKPKALFEATLAYHVNGTEEYFDISGEISRIDRYEPHSKCTHDDRLKKYCYCNDSQIEDDNIKEVNTNSNNESKIGIEE